MDLNKYSSYLSLDPSALYAAQRLVERVVRYHDDHESMVQELEESLHGKTLEYALELFGETISEGLEYMGVSIAFNGKTYSAPTVGLYGVKSKPEIKSGIKAKVLAKNDREQKEEYEVSVADKKGNTKAYQNYKAGMKNKKTGQPLYKAGKGVEEALDPVGQEDGDVNNDGKKDKTDNYLKKRRATISKAIAAKEEHEIEALVDYFVTEQIVENEQELDELMFEIDEEHTEYFLEKAMELKGKKKGNVIINPKTEKMQEEEGSGNDQVVMNNQKRMMQKKHQMDRQKMQLKKQGKLNVNSESVEVVSEVDYSGTPAKNDAESDKAKQYPTFAELKAKLAQAGDPAKGIPAGTQLSQTSLKKEEVENVEELYKGKHGQTEKQYQDSRSDAGKMVSGDSKSSGSRYAQGRRTSSDAGPQPAGGSKKPASQGKMDSGSRTDLTFRKAALKKKAADMKKEEVVNEEGADSLKDRRMERGGVDGNNRYNNAPGKPNTFGKKKPVTGGPSAMDKVKAKIRAKYGDKAIVDTNKK
jgi:hypothetical protein